MKLILILLLVLVSLLGHCNPGQADRLSLPDVCSENPSYAEAIAALNWIAAHPDSPEAQTASNFHGSHAILDSIYDGLLEQGKVAPVPPPCTVTARAAVPVLSDHAAGAAQIGTLETGTTADVQARTEDGGWWYISTAFGWGWVAAESVDVQAGAVFDQFLITG